MTRFIYDLRTPRQRGLVADERAAMHRAELRLAVRERRDAEPRPRHPRWWPRFAGARPHTQELGTQVAELQHRVEHLERRLRTLSPSVPRTGCE